MPDANPSPATPSPLPTPPPVPVHAPADAGRIRPLKSFGLGAILEALLKRPDDLLETLRGPHQGGILARLIALILVCGCVYGLVMGSLSGGTQLWAAPLKLTSGLFLSILLCLPSLYIFLCLDGADLGLGQIGGAFLGMVALIAVLLIGFAPVAWIFSQSTDSVVTMGILHLFFWVIGLWFGLRLIKGLLACGEVADRGHLKIWTIIFVLVSLQMTAVLRPLIGTADTLLPTEKKFFAQHWIDSMNGR